MGCRCMKGENQDQNYSEMQKQKVKRTIKNKYQNFIATEQSYLNKHTPHDGKRKTIQ